MKNNENNREKNKIIGPAGSRTSTRQHLARGLRPLQGRFSANARAFKAPGAARVQALNACAR